MMAFMQYALQVIMSFMFLAVLMIFLPRAQVSASRIGEILNTRNSISECKNPEKLSPTKKGLVEFRNVTFSYPDADTPILNDISFVAKPGETTAFIGSTGSGKSTLINLIPRFYDTSAGEILLDGVNIKKISREDLVKIIGYVPQKGVLFSGNVESNIKYGAPEISQGKVEKAAEIAQADFIKDLENNFKHHISQGGSNVSGGQKQRLSIARAIAKDPEILIFDDSFSALDYKTDANLRKSLKKNSMGKTVLIVAQRISTIKNAEQIIVLDEGKVVGNGSHYELLKTSEVYREIARSQFSENEMKKELEIAKKIKKGSLRNNKSNPIENTRRERNA
jgi:ATP-binding cassette subfamily B protein